MRAAKRSSASGAEILEHRRRMLAHQERVAASG